MDNEWKEESGSMEAKNYSSKQEQEEDLNLSKWKLSTTRRLKSLMLLSNYTMLVLFYSSLATCMLIWKACMLAL